MEKCLGECANLVGSLIWDQDIVRVQAPSPLFLLQKTVASSASLVELWKVPAVKVKCGRGWSEGWLPSDLYAG